MSEANLYFGLLVVVGALIFFGRILAFNLKNKKIVGTLEKTAQQLGFVFDKQALRRMVFGTLTGKYKGKEVKISYLNQNYLPDFRAKVGGNRLAPTYISILQVKHGKNLPDFMLNDDDADLKNDAALSLGLKFISTAFKVLPKGTQQVEPAKVEVENRFIVRGKASDEQMNNLKAIFTDAVFKKYEDADVESLSGDANYFEIRKSGLVLEPNDLTKYLDLVAEL